MQSQPRNISVSFGRSRMEPSINTAPFCKCSGARISKIIGVSPLSSSFGTRAWPRFPDPPVRSTFIVLLRDLAHFGTQPDEAGTLQAFKTIKTELLDRTIEAHNGELLSQRATGCSSSSGV